MTTQTIIASAAESRERLRLLFAERAIATQEGLAGNALYMADLDEEIAATHAAYVGAAVIEIATLRGALHGRLNG